jgi:BT1 family
MFVSLCVLHQGFYRPLLNVYPLDLHATEAQQSTLTFVVSLPATTKIIYGFLSDNYPLFGYRRKPYMVLGWSIVSLMMILLRCSADLSMSYESSTTKSKSSAATTTTMTLAPVAINAVTRHKHMSVPPINAPSIDWLALCFFLFGLGLWLADVMADSIVVSLSSF